VVDHIGQSEKIWLCIAPEGTRKKVERFRTGFLRIAHAANIPILLLAFDWPNRVIRLGPLWYPSQDTEADRIAIEQWLALPGWPKANQLRSATSALRLLAGSGLIATL